MTRALIPLSGCLGHSEIVRRSWRIAGGRCRMAGRTLQKKAQVGTTPVRGSVRALQIEMQSALAARRNCFVWGQVECKAMRGGLGYCHARTNTSQTFSHLAGVWLPPPLPHCLIFHFPLSSIPLAIFPISIFSLGLVSSPCFSACVSPPRLAAAPGPFTPRLPYPFPRPAVALSHSAGGRSLCASLKYNKCCDILA